MMNIEQLAIDNKQEFYVHRKGTFTGNAPSFWAKDDCGYTSYINGAKRFSAKEAYELYKDDPNKWEIFNCDAVDARLHLVFDIQDKKMLGTDLPCGHKFGYAKALQQQSEPVAEHSKCISHLWEMIGRWSAYLASNGEDANLAPPDYLIDAIKNATQPPNTVSLEAYNKLLDALKEYAVWEIVGKGRTKIPKNNAAQAIAEAERSAK